MLLAARSMFYVLAVLSLASACGGDEGDGDSPRSGTGGGPSAGTGGGGDQCVGTDPNRNTVTPAQLCDRLASIQCAAAAECCTAEAVNVASCKSDAMAECATLGMVAADARVGFDAAAVSDLFDEYEMRACACDTTIANLAGSMGVNASFKGTVAADGDCEPAGGIMADLPELLAALGSCNRAAGLACLATATSWQCKQRGGAGSPCFTDDNCTAGNYCEGALSEDFDGVCTAAKAAGANCSLPTECASLICGGDNKCAAAGDTQAVFCPG